jgi:hypothetical protein
MARGSRRRGGGGAKGGLGGEKLEVSISDQGGERREGRTLPCGCGEEIS